MNDFPQKINNSYESGSSSSESASNHPEQGLDKSMQLDDIDGHKLTSLMLPREDLHNSSVEEGIFPNVPNYQHIEVPSYQPEYDYINGYTNSPLVYSWLPIVPGFTQDGFDNLHNFQHLSDKHQDCEPGSIGSQPVPNQNIKYHEFLAINNDPKLLSLHTGVDFNELENSCNAMDLDISCKEDDESTLAPELSFNGRITELRTFVTEDLMRENSEAAEGNKNVFKEIANVEKLPVRQEVSAVSEGHPKSEAVVEQSEEERLHNESFEMLKKEDSSKMVYINEKSPDFYNSRGDVLSDTEPRDEVEMSADEVRPSGDCDSSILIKMQSSLTGICPPPSVTRFQLSLSEMLSTYQNNLNEKKVSTTIKSNSFFVPSHETSEVESLEWPGIVSTRCLDVYYNKNDSWEEIENIRLRYVDRYIGAETSTSFTHKIGPSSAKKRMEKLKLITQSPGSRLSHLAKRRNVFSSANLKSSSLMIDKSKLYGKVPKVKSPKKRASAKKKTPGKKKTPKSAKRLSSAIPESSRASKRALFMSPVVDKPPVAPKAVKAVVPARGPRRILFSDNDENKKRRRSTSPDHDAENRVGKLRRLESPTKMPKSLSFSVAPSTSAMSRETSFIKRSLYRTQSEVARPTGVKTGVSLGLKDKFTEEMKKKFLWSVSTALSDKKISKSHENFSSYGGVLAKLVKKAFIEFYNPSVRSISAQFAKFANFMVSYVIQGRPANEIYAMMAHSMQSKNATRLTGYIAQQDFDRQCIVRKNSSLMLMSESCSSLNISQQSENSFDGGSMNSSKLSISNTSLNRSSSKNNEMLALRENFLGLSNEKSAKKFSGSDSNLNRLVKSTSSSNLMKAKRQISF